MRDTALAGEYINVAAFYPHNSLQFPAPNWRYQNHAKTARDLTHKDAKRIPRIVSNFDCLLVTYLIMWNDQRLSMPLTKKLHPQPLAVLMISCLLSLKTSCLVTSFVRGNCQATEDWPNKPRKKVAKAMKLLQNVVLIRTYPRAKVAVLASGKLQSGWCIVLQPMAS